MRRISSSRFKAVTCAIAVVACLGLAACATLDPGLPTETGGPSAVARPAAADDPLEAVNRPLFALGRVIDRAILRPLVGGYQRLVPRPLQRGVHNIAQNADEPVVVVNDLLQLRAADAARTSARFLTNTVLGIGGLFDPAVRLGLAHHDNGFGLTLGRAGVGAGPYIYLPVLGPTDLRDLLGAAVDYLTDPLSLTNYKHTRVVDITRTILSLADARIQAEADLQALELTSVDAYATMRSVFLQSREAEVKDRDPPLQDLPDLPDSPGTGPPPSAAVAPAEPSTPEDDPPQ